MCIRDRWWESIQGGGATNYGKSTSTSEKPERKPEELNDLRPDATPLRSDVMLDAISAAIARYEQLVANGGWPVSRRSSRPRGGRSGHGSACPRTLGHGRKLRGRQHLTRGATRRARRAK